MDMIPARCPSCNRPWSATEKATANREVCPFCGASMMAAPPKDRPADHRRPQVPKKTPEQKAAAQARERKARPSHGVAHRVEERMRARREAQRLA